MSAPVSSALLLAVAVQISCQLFKFILYSIRDRRVTSHYLVTAGGMPSAHSAFVSALSTAIAFRHGLDSDLFAVAFVFSAIVAYDAYRLRGHVQEHAVRINRIEAAAFSALVPDGQRPLSEMVGHSIPEIASGIVYGVIATALVAAYLPA